MKPLLPLLLLAILACCTANPALVRAPCRLTPAEVTAWNERAYQWSIENARKIPPVDSALFTRLSVDLDTYIQDRIERIDRLTKGKNWKRMSIYLWTDPGEAERLAARFGFAYPFYFTLFLQRYDRPNSCRERMIARIRRRVAAETGDVAVDTMNSYDLLRYSFRVNVRNYHQH